ncbi:MAG: hypothetical protein KF724_03365 [Phycisphaeraceae bacterium]|nr:hypothetical protein [Phycisphaeraceae bacterium]
MAEVSRRLRPIGVLVTLLLLPTAIGLGGCEQERMTESRLLMPPPLQPGGDETRRDGFLRVAIEPLGEVSNDGFTLPLCSPDGRFIAVQAMSNADWPTLTAGPEQARAVRGRIVIYEVLLGALQPLGEVAGPYLLGRSASDEGFLVESPREDGSRAIGLVRWDDRQIEWLIEDSFVNAFAVLGPRGTWAYSRRPVDGRGFELVIERPEGRMVFSTGRDHSWLLPRFDGDGNLFALRLTDGTLAMGFLPMTPGIAESAETLRPAVRMLPLSLRGSPDRALATMTPTDGLAPVGLSEQVLFFHPDFRRMALWDAGSDSPQLLVDGSVGAAIIPDGKNSRAIVASPNRLLEQAIPPRPGDVPLRVLEGLWLPRTAPTTDGQVLMVSPDRARLILTRLTIQISSSSSSSSSSSKS